MAAQAGKDGAVKLGSTMILNITEWSGDFAGDTEDTTPFQPSGGWRTNTATVKKWSAKCSGNFDAADTSGQVALHNGLLSTYTLNLMTDATHQWSGSAILVGIGDKTSATGMVTTEYSFTGNGAATYS